MGDGYSAGLIDGEGYIGIQEAGGSFQVRLKVGMTDKGLPALRQLRTRYGGKITADRPQTGNWRASFVWRLTGTAASRVIEELQPLFLVKSEAAAIALRFQQMVDASPRLPNGRATWTDEMRRRASQFVGQIQEANRRGPDPEPPLLPSARPLAVYRWGTWWDPDEDLFGPVEFSGRFPNAGLMVAGRIYERPASEGPTAYSLLPTPRTSDTNGAGSHGTGGLDLRTAVDLLPTPTATPYGNNQSQPPLSEVILPLLPTPLSSDAGPRGGTTGYGLRDWSRAISTGASTPPPSTDGNESSAG